MLTTEELRILAKSLLEDYRPHLKALEKQKFEAWRKPARILVTFERPLDSFDDREMRFEISKVLDQLASIKDGFSMTDPDYGGTGEITVLHGDLCISFLNIFDADEYKSKFHISCYFYPVKV